MLSLITFLPLLGVAAIMVTRQFAGPLKEDRDGAARMIALVTTTGVLVLSVILVVRFDPSASGFQFNEEADWFAGLHYRMGVDGISVLFILLTAFLFPLC